MRDERRVRYKDMPEMVYACAENLRTVQMEFVRNAVMAHRYFVYLSGTEIGGGPSPNEWQPCSGGVFSRNHVDSFEALLAQDEPFVIFFNMKLYSENEDPCELRMGASLSKEELRAWIEYFEQKFEECVTASALLNP